ncbi:MAG: hypothetical protein ACF8LL_05555, partial [Phycisphaerales bacterium]
MRIALALLSIVSTACAQEFLSLEIIGPEEVTEQVDEAYVCLAHYDDGDIDVTNQVQWSVTPSMGVSIDAGVLSTVDLHASRGVQVRATFAPEDATAMIEVQVIALYAQVDELIRPDLPNLGADIEIEGDVALIGALNSVLVMDVSTRETIREIQPGGLEQIDRFGYAVASHGDLAIIGSDGTEISGVFRAGTAYIYDLTTGEQVHQLVSDDPQPYDSLGCSVAIGPKYAIAGATEGNTRGPGHAFVFDIETGEIVRRFEPKA